LDIVGLLRDVHGFEMDGDGICLKEKPDAVTCHIFITMKGQFTTASIRKGYNGIHPSTARPMGTFNKSSVSSTLPLYDLESRVRGACDWAITLIELSQLRCGHSRPILGKAAHYDIDLS
jgi:hypothetical protein